MLQTSLIPKKIAPRFSYSSETFGVFFRIAVIFFLIAGALAAGLFAYDSLLVQKLEEQKTVLQKLDNEIEPTLLAQLEKVAKDVGTARKLLERHVHLTKIFQVLEENTLTVTKFNSFSYNDDSKTMALNGEAVSYAAVAAQARVFEKLQTVVSASFSNFQLQSNGNVSFSLNVIFK